MHDCGQPTDYGQDRAAGPNWNRFVGDARPDVKK